MTWARVGIVSTDAASYRSRATGRCCRRRERRPDWTRGHRQQHLLARSGVEGRHDRSAGRSCQPSWRSSAAAAEGALSPVWGRRSKTGVAEAVSCSGCGSSTDWIAAGLAAAERAISGEKAANRALLHGRTARPAARLRPTLDRTRPSAMKALARGPGCACCIGSPVAGELASARGQRLRDAAVCSPSTHRASSPASVRAGPAGPGAPLGRRLRLTGTCVCRPSAALRGRPARCSLGAREDAAGHAPRPAGRRAPELRCMAPAASAGQSSPPAPVAPPARGAPRRGQEAGGPGCRRSRISGAGGLGRRGASGQQLDDLGRRLRRPRPGRGAREPRATGAASGSGTATQRWRCRYLRRGAARRR